MIAAKLIFQTIVGLSIFGSVIGGGIMWSNNSMYDENKPQIILVFNTDSTLSNGGVFKNTSCFVKGTTTSEKMMCSVYKLVASTESDPKTLVNLKTIVDTPTNKVETLEINKKYILTLEKDKYEKILGNNKKIEIKDANDKSLIEFAPTTIIDGTLENPKTNLIIANAFSIKNPATTETLDNNKKYFCQFLDKNPATKFECNIYKPSGTKTTNTFTDTELAASAIPTTPSEIAKDKFFVVDLKNNATSIDDLRNTKIKLFVLENTTAADTNKEVASFTYEQALIGDLKSTTGKFAYRLSPKRETYYVTQIAEKHAGADVQLTTTANGTTTKAYKCKVKDETSSNDTTCSLISLPEFNTTNNTITLSQAKTASTEITSSSVLVKDSFFKLTINHSNLPNWNLESKDIEIISSATEATKYATLKILAKENGENVVGKGQYFVGKTETATSLTDVSALECEISGATESNAAKSCVVYKFTTQPDDNKNHEDLNMQQATKITEASHVVASSYYLVDLKEQKLDFTASKTTSIKVKKTSENDPSFLINLQTPVVGIIDSTTSTNNKVIFLN